jgi:hypothetical protein
MGNNHFALVARAQSPRTRKKYGLNKITTNRAMSPNKELSWVFYYPDETKDKFGPAACSNFTANISDVRSGGIISDIMLLSYPLDFKAVTDWLGNLNLTARKMKAFLYILPLSCIKQHPRIISTTQQAVLYFFRKLSSYLPVFLSG